MDTLSQLPLFSQHIVILLAVIAIKSLVAQFSPLTKVSLFSLYCQRLSDKVNRPNNSDKQRKIAGFVATLITLSPVVIILWLFADFVAVPWLWQALLLYFSLGAFGAFSSIKQLAEALNKQDKLQAKQTLLPWVLRDVEQMSVLGLSKAAIEMLAIKSFQQQFVVGFIFIVCGPLFAFSYRMLLEMHYAWNIKSHNFVQFGAFVNQIVKLIQWIPARLYFCLLFISHLHQSPVLYWRLVKKHFFQLNNNLLISYWAYLLEVQLGGVAMYNKNKLRRLSFNDKAQQPHPQNLYVAIKQLQLMNILVLSLLIIIGLLSLMSV